MFGLAWHTVVLVFGLAVFAPVRFGELSSHPHPVADYGGSVARIAAWQSADDSVASPGGRSILLTHGHRTPRAIILFHGLSDSPLQFQEVAQEMYDEGANVFVPRFPYHAERDGNVRLMSRLTAQDLRNLGDAAVDVAHALGDTLIVAGLSAGGNVAAWAGQYRPEVQRVVLIAPALSVTRVPAPFRGAVLRLALRAPNVTRSEPRDSTEPDRIPGWATHVLAQTVMLGGVVRGAAASRKPAATELAVLLNASDRTVSNASALELAQHWSDHGTRVHVYQLPDSLRLPHDIIDPRHPGSDTAAVYPVLTALLAGERPPASARDVSSQIRVHPVVAKTPAPVPLQTSSSQSLRQN